MKQRELFQAHRLNFAGNELHGNGNEFRWKHEFYFVD